MDDLPDETAHYSAVTANFTTVDLPRDKFIQSNTNGARDVLMTPKLC
ncbi:hypothetical protein [Marinobacter nanhaiticus]|nr:hypothetical protein [Marinobacter nanhaiticus]